MAGNEKNLKANSERSPSERRALAKKAGIASGKARREKKAMRETLEELLTMPIKSGELDDIEKIKSLAGMRGKNISTQEAIMISMIKKAIKGDVKAAEYIRDTAGQKQTEKLELNNRVEIDEKVHEIAEYLEDKSYE